MAAMSQLTEEEKNFTKFFLLNFKVSTEITRRYFDIVFPQIAQTLNNINHVIFNRRLINATQLGILRSIPGTNWPSYLPALPPGTKATSSKDFDLTLMVCLLRNFGGLSQPSNGWDQLPHPNDMSTGAHLATLKWYRNQLAHTSVCFMPNTDFTDQWTRAEKALTYLNFRQIPQEATDLFNLDLDGEVAKSVAEGEIKQLRHDYLDCERELQQIKSEFSHYRDGHLPKNIKDANEILVNTWQMEDDIFYETRGTQHISDKVKDFDCILVTGMSGYGKTAAIRHIALLLKSEDFDILSIETPEDIIKYQTDQNQVFLIDDVVGKHDLIHNLLEKWEIINEKLIAILNAKKGTKKILCTLRNQVALQERFKNASTILNKFIMNLNEEPNALSLQEKKNILSQHLENHKLENEMTKEEADVICKSDYAFPLLCKLATSDVERFKQRDSFFKQPLSFMRGELDKMHTQNKKLYFTLVLCMLYNGALKKSLFNVDSNDEKICRIMDKFGLQMMDLEACALSAVGSYFTNNENSFKFIHDALEETVAYHFCRLNPEVMLAECNILFIRDRVRVQSNKNVEENIVILQEEELNKDYLRPIYNRFMCELKLGRFSNVLMSQLINKRQFVRVFATVINQNISICKLLKTVSTERLLISVILKNLEEKDKKKKDKTHDFIKQRKEQQDKNDAIDRVTDAISPRSTLIYWIVAFGCYEFFEYAWRTMTIIQHKWILGRDFSSLLFAKSFFPLAVLGGNIDIISELIFSGADVNCSSEFWETPLYIAAKLERLDIVQVLVTNGAKVNLRGCFNMNIPIITSKNPVLTTILLQHDLLQTELHKAILQDNLEIVKANIRSININSKTKSGWTPVHYAVALKKLEVVRILLNEFNDADSIGLETQRISNKRPKPNINIQDNNGLTAIHLAVINDDIDTLTVLLQYNAEIKVRDDYDRTPLHYTRSVGVTKALLAYRNNNIEAGLAQGSINEYINNPTSALRTVFCNITLSTAFRSVFCDFVNTPDKEGNTPLHVHAFRITNSCSETERNTIIEILLQNGADPFLDNDREDSFQTISNQGRDSWKYTYHKNKNTGLMSSYSPFFSLEFLFFAIVTFLTISLRESGSVFCQTDEFGNLHSNDTIWFHHVTAAWPVILITIVFLGFLFIINDTKYYPFWKRVENVIILAACLFLTIASPFVYALNAYQFISQAFVLALFCNMLRQMISNIHSLLEMHLLNDKCKCFFVFIDFICVVFAMLLIPARKVTMFFVSRNHNFLNDINILEMNFSNCSTLSVANISCVGLGHNVTFKKDVDFSLKCNTVSNTTNYSGNLTMNSGVSESDIDHISLLYLTLSCTALCIYTVVFLIACTASSMLLHTRTTKRESSNYLCFQLIRIEWKFHIPYPCISQFLVICVVQILYTGQ